MLLDILIKDGFVVDGTGSPGKRCDVGIIGDRIEAVGNLGGTAAKHTIEAENKVVCPGFIDVHVHSELALLGGPDRYAPLRMGVTTQLAGPDGFSWAPMSKARLREQKDYLHVFYDDPLIDTSGDMTIDGYLEMFRGKLPSNLVLQVPHGALRVEAMGWAARPASEEELGKMERLARAWMEAGAVSFCTGLEYEPMRHAGLDELVRLSKIAAEYGGIYVAHQRGYADNVRIGCGETFAIAEQADIPVHISHLTVDDAAAGQLEWARSRGIDLTFDMYPYPAGCTHLLMGLPEALQAGSPEQVKARIAQRSVRREYAGQLANAFPLDRVVFAAAGTAQPSKWEGKTLRQVQQDMQMDLPDAICEILLQTNLQALMVYHWPAERHSFLESTFKHPAHMVGTDGVYVGLKPHPRGFGSYPKVLGQFVRENRWIRLEEAIYKMSGFPARTFRIKDRGVLAKNHYADIVIFDPDKVEGLATFEEPRLAPVGIEKVIVNGNIVINDGEIYQGLYGRVL
jgi:N-acyl-D-amino-acid deacylase